MGDGLLLPHVRVKEIQTPLLALGVCASGIALPAGKRAEFVLLLLTPVSDPRIHLQLIQAFGDLLVNSERKARMLAAATSAELFNVLNLP
jgi:mannitol/fructose-specific phosphotransferase system IIA component (Ntr-type)